LGLNQTQTNQWQTLKLFDAVSTEKIRSLTVNSEHFNCRAALRTLVFEGFVFPSSAQPLFLIRDVRLVLNI
jgi:hypothetical protein